MGRVDKDDQLYKDFLEVNKLLAESETPQEDRWVVFNKETFLACGGTEEAWEKLEKIELH